MQNDVSSNNKRIAKNTLMLYFRMLFTMFVGLYTSRVVLAALGISDYGLYNVVAGVIGMFGFLTSMLSAGTTRFITYEIGSGNKVELKKIFSTALTMYLGMAAIIFILGETVGLWFVMNKMNFDPGREVAALWVYQFTVFTAIVALIQAPFMASLIAHEKMNTYAYMSIYDVTMKLLIAYLIQMAPFDRLIFYGFLIMLVSLSSTCIYNIYCHRHYEECRFTFHLDKLSFRKMFSFSAWDMVGNMAGIAQTQGVSIVLNMFCGTVVNAAQGIANSLNGIIMQFVNNFQVAVNPQIIKYYAAGQVKEMIELVFNNAKYGAYLILFFAIPVVIEAEYILGLWLGEYPPLAPTLFRIIILESLFQSMGVPTVKAVHATGRLKDVNLTIGILLLSILPVCYCLLKFGVEPQWVVLASVIPWLLAIPFRLYWLNRYCGFPIRQFIYGVIGKVFFMAAILFALPFVASFFIVDHEHIRFFTVGTVSVVWSGTIIYYFGLDKTMRTHLNGFVFSKLHFVKNR